MYLRKTVKHPKSYPTLDKPLSSDEGTKTTPSPTKQLNKRQKQTCSQTCHSVLGGDPELWAQHAGPGFKLHWKPAGIPGTGSRCGKCEQWQDDGDCAGYSRQSGQEWNWRWNIWGSEDGKFRRGSAHGGAWIQPPPPHPFLLESFSLML